MVIDPHLKKWGLIVLSIFLLGPLASKLWDGWMDQTQQDMVDNQAKLAAHAKGLATTLNQAEIMMAARNRCEPQLRSQMCSEPGSMSEVEDCLLGLGMRDCHMLPELNLCGVVEKLEICADIFADQQKNGCARLRRVADCKNIPAPEDLQKVWHINFDSD